MSDIDNGWRIEQIAKTILYRYFGNISIERTNEGLCDFIVTYNDGTGLRFGVVVKKSTLNKNSQFQSLIDSYKQSDFNLAANRIPIIALSVEEFSESAKMAFLVGWRFGKPQIYKDFEFRNLNEKSAAICLQIIKSMDSVIRCLSTDDLNVLKRISFSKKMYDGRIQQAEILYLRKLSTTYKMTDNLVVDERERLERLQKGTPEKEYPKDELDEIILKSVKRKYKNAIISSKLLLFSTELDDLQHYKKIHCAHTTLVVSPNTLELSGGAITMLNGLELFSVDLELYVESIFYPNAFDGDAFWKEEPVDGWIEKLVDWNNMKKTMRPISVYFR